MLYKPVTEKRFKPDEKGEEVVDHNRLLSLYDGWTSVEGSEDTDFRQAAVGRMIDGKYVQRYLKAATIVAVR